MGRLGKILGSLSEGLLGVSKSFEDRNKEDLVEDVTKKKRKGLKDRLKKLPGVGTVGMED